MFHGNFDKTLQKIMIMTMQNFVRNTSKNSLTNPMKCRLLKGINEGGGRERWNKRIKINEKFSHTEHCFPIFFLFYPLLTVWLYVGRTSCSDCDYRNVSRYSVTNHSNRMVNAMCQAHEAIDD
jgi:hypothetical protein